MNYEAIAAYLAGECNDAEKQEIESWRKADAENEQTFQQWQLLWQASGNNYQNYEPDLTKAWQKINPAGQLQTPFKITKHSPKPKLPATFIWIRNIAAGLVLTIGLGWSIWRTADYFAVPATAWIEKTTTAQTKEEVVLPDGTRVWLNAKSKLRYQEQFTTASREVFLEGEAFFEVVKDPQKPFIVHTRQSATEVLGTSFSIRAYSLEPTVEVIVVTGKVAFSEAESPSGEKVNVLPNQKAVLHKAHHTITVSDNEDYNFLAWKTGKFKFQDTPLRKALPELEEYYQVAFSVSDSFLLNCRFTGSFEGAPLEDVLQVFAFGSDISYRKEDNGYVLSGEGCR